MTSKLKPSVLWLWIATVMAAQNLPALESWSLTELDASPTSIFSGEKPQSKVWYYAGLWWGVWSDSSGTWLHRHD